MLLTDLLLADLLVEREQKKGSLRRRIGVVTAQPVVNYLLYGVPHAG